MDELEGKPKCFGGYACERLNHMHLGKAFRGKPRRKPESGNPTFRDCRGASGNVTLVELRTHLATERAGMVTLHLTVGAPELYPDHVRFCERLCQEDEKSSCCTEDGDRPSEAVL